MSEMMTRLLVETLLQELEARGGLREAFREEFGCPVEVERLGERTLIRFVPAP